ncbi:hypothetical protein [Bradyrhizobium neotropicale]|uniref:hypothetical protein n=1 Tax=Bradyrhizobium neotropicale TaxID=1497615 RepID=UPI001AD61F62|nr:hypothetical protein [Bradyrhizobium neotropicale]MBO4222000.1 hypothetical protein [Bradyrhizobium neotropicale]
MRFVIGKHGLRPFDKAARDFLDSLTTTEPIEVEALHPHDAAFRRHIFGVLEALADGLHTTPEVVRAKLLMSTGNFQLVGHVMGSTVIAVSSMSRSAMRDPELRTFWDEAKTIITDNMLACIKDDAERHRVEELLSLEPA